ncbi:unnamed protein product [Eruca vesicaria subsp. sativa]|uniref:Uncharacterized protein n=1 Tax=Eruca vesicaria subsp. sativa TaxID=29727 RepID=A0ABC8LJQ4_ERUVS|nr:unnamed protein product [Eruca vesicaria subsp. sativa]
MENLIWLLIHFVIVIESGLAVGKGSASGSGVSFQREEQPLANAAEAGNGASEKADPSAPGALFEDKTLSANDSWRKLHSDPLLLIRQREQEALAGIKNNPIKMSLIRKSVEEKGEKQHRKETSSRHHSDSEGDSGEESGRKPHHHRTSVDHDEDYERRRSESEDESKRREGQNRKRKTEDFDNDKHPSRENRYHNRRRNGGVSKLSEEERAARFKQMQMDAEVHEEQRWRRLKKADETDAVEASKNNKVLRL